jgi:hypothetical protein
MPFPLLAAIGIGGAAGAGVGLFSTAVESKNARKQLLQQKELAWSQYLLGQEYSDTQFALQRGEAAGQLVLQRRRLDEGVDRSLAQFNAGLLGQAYAAQDAQIQTASAIGASVAAEGASGTRGSSGGGLMRAYQRQSLDRSLALQEQQNALGLAGLAADASNARQDMGRELASWKAGGFRFESKQAQDAYNKSVAELGQTDFDWRIGHAAAGWEDYLLGAFGGASSGIGLGSSAYGFSQSFDGVGGQAARTARGYGEAGRGYTNNGMSLDWRIR